MEMRTHHHHHHHPSKSKRGSMSMEEEDRLSSLPDDLLHSILRLLPFKHAVQTSTLSRRWAPQWLRALASSGVLDFTGGHPPARATAATLRRCLELHAEHGAPLDVFRVVLTSPPAGAASRDGAFGRDVAGWIASAVARGAREVEVDLAPTKGDDAEDGRSASPFVELPGDLFVARNSLARLALGGFGLGAVLGAAPAAGLAGLRSLSLGHAGVTDEALGVVVSSCRALESLSLSSCNLLKHVRIASGTLRVLEMVRCPAVWDVEVDTPALESFAFHGSTLYVVERKYDEDNDGGGGYLDYSSGINLGSQSTPALRDVYLSHIGIDFYDEERAAQFHFGDEHIIEQLVYGVLLSSVGHAQVWTLCSVGLEYLERCKPYQYLVNTNVQELQLLMASVVVDDCVVLQFMSISNFFDMFGFPLLERLIIRFPAGDATDASDADVVAALAREVADVCKSEIYEADIELDSLRFIKLVNLRGTRFERELITFLLSLAPAREQMVLVTVEQEGGAPGQVDEHVEVIQTPESAFCVTVCRPSKDRGQNPVHTRIYHEE